MGSEIIAGLTGLFCTTVSSIVTFILTKKKYNQDVEAQHIENIKEAFDTYKMTVKETFSSQNEKIEALQKENENLKQKINLLQTQIVNLIMTKSMAGMANMIQGINIPNEHTEGV